MKKLLKIIIVAALLGGLGYAIYDLIKPNEKYEIKLWDNIYNGDSIEFFYEEENDLRIEMLRAIYNLDKIEKEDDEIKYILKNALTDKINDRDVYMKGIDNSYYYEGYVTYRAEEV